MPVERGERFSITYVHSVMKTPVTDVFRYDQVGQFMLERTEYQSFGAGLPTENFGEFEHVNGIYINGGINRPLEVIRQRVGRFANHRVIFENGVVVTLDEYVPGGDLVTLSPSYQLRILTYFSKGDETID